MQIFRPNYRAAIKLKSPYRIGEKLDFRFLYDAPVWTANTVRKNGDVVKPTVENGFYYQCVDGGKSAATEPAWSSVEGEETVDGSATWKTLNDTVMLQDGETLASSEWSVTDDAQIDEGATIIGAAWDAGTVTFTIGEHGHAVGETVVVASVVPFLYNNSYVVAATTATTVSAALATDPGTYREGGMLYPRSHVTLGSGIYAATYDATSATVWVVGVEADTRRFTLRNTVTTSNTPARQIVREMTVMVA